MTFHNEHNYLYLVLGGLNQHGDKYCVPEAWLVYLFKDCSYLNWFACGKNKKKCKAFWWYLQTASSQYKNRHATREKRVFFYFI